MTSGYFLSTVAQKGHYQAQLVLLKFEKQANTMTFQWFPDLMFDLVD